jgi:glycine cleavage system regulatory protein
MAQTVTKIKWNEADILWNSNPFTWDEVQLIQEIAEELEGTGGVSKTKVIRELPDEKKEKLIRLIMRRKGIKVYDEKKKVKEVEIKVEDVELLIKEVKAFVMAENIDV